MVLLGGNGRLGVGAGLEKEGHQKDAFERYVFSSVHHFALLPSYQEVSNFASSNTLTTVMFCLAPGPWQWSKLSVD